MNQARANLEKEFSNNDELIQLKLHRMPCCEKQKSFFEQINMHEIKKTHIFVCSKGQDNSLVPGLISTVAPNPTI